MTQFALGTVKGNGIVSIEKTGTSGLVDTYTITFDNGDTETFDVTNGSDGSEVTITQVLSSGTKLATITIDGTSTDLYCNSGGSADIVTSWESTLSDEKVPSEKLTKETIDSKGTKVTSWSGTVSDSNYPSEKLTKDSLDAKISKSNTTGLVKNDGSIDTTSYSTFSGSYSDLSNKPSIPSSSSDLSDGSDIIKKSNTSGLVKNDGSIDTTSYISSLPSASTSISGIVQLVDNLTTSDDTKALTAKQGKAIADMIGDAITYINGTGS